VAQQELEAALRRDGEQRAHTIWRKVEGEAECLRRETAQRLEIQRQAVANSRRTEIAALHDNALAAARRQGQNCRLTAEAALAERLQLLAQGLLKELALSGGVALFQALTAEIPAYSWQRVRVARRDAGAARETFPSAEIETDQGISAGLEVESADGRIRIINTLEKRLTHLWPELLPELFRELRPMAGDDETLT